MEKFKQFTISTRPFNADILSGLLWEFDITGIVENDTSLIVFAKENSLLTDNLLNKYLSDLKRQGLFTEYKTWFFLLEKKNWNKEWEKRTKVIEATDKIVIKPTFRNYRNIDNKLVIQIDPKMSFGTGEHQTTRLMLQFLEKYIKPDLRILDVGLGTGILSIAAAMLTKTKFILGIDNDEWCIINSKENIALNNLQNRIKIKLAEISQILEKNFDLITANINKNVLTEITGSLSKKLKTNGILIISGIYKKDVHEIETLFTKYGFRKNESQSIDEWAALVLTKIS